jgi:hypothetical protein
MSLPRQDVRFKLDAVAHAQLKAICEQDGTDINDFMEALLLPVINKRVHDAIELANKFQRLGISGNARESSGNSSFGGLQP